MAAAAAMGGRGGCEDAARRAVSSSRMPPLPPPSPSDKSSMPGMSTSPAARYAWGWENSAPADAASGLEGAAAVATGEPHSRAAWCKNGRSGGTLSGSCLERGGGGESKAAARERISPRRATTSCAAHAAGGYSRGGDRGGDEAAGATCAAAPAAATAAGAAAAAFASPAARAAATAAAAAAAGTTTAYRMYLHVVPLRFPVTVCAVSAPYSTSARRAKCTSVLLSPQNFSASERTKESHRMECR